MSLTGRSDTVSPNETVLMKEADGCIDAGVGWSLLVQVR